MGFLFGFAGWLGYIVGMNSQILKRKLIAGLVLLLGGSLFIEGVLIAQGYVNTQKAFGICGWQQKYQLPCPTCGMTRSLVAFCDGDFLKSVYIQPTAGIMCGLLVIATGISVLELVFGPWKNYKIDPDVTVKKQSRMARCLDSFYMGLNKIKKWQFVIFFLLLVLGGWAVTMSRALALK